MTVRFRWNGKALRAEAGDSIAAALAANDVTALGETRTGRRRGIFCGMGACHECLVSVDGSRSQRACMVQVREGMDIRSQRDSEPAGRNASQGERPQTRSNFDIAVVGAGPGGLAAAIALDALDFSVCVLDEREQLGGQYYKPRSGGFRGAASADRQHREGEALRKRAVQGNIEFRLGATAWCARRGQGDDSHRFVIKAFQNGGTATVGARALAIATGAVETPAIVPGWTAPGAMTIGAAQTLARRYGVLPGRRILVASNGPLGLQLAAEIHALGGEVVGLYERSRVNDALALLMSAGNSPGLVARGAMYAIRLAMAGIKTHYGWEVSEIHGAERVEGVSLRRMEDGLERTVAADAACIGEGFAPEHDLARQLGVPVDVSANARSFAPQRGPDGKTPVEGVWIVGDAGGLGGAQAAERQGLLAASGIAGYLGKSAGANNSAARNLARFGRFQKALWTLYGAPPRRELQSNAVICRCEEVTVAEVSAAVERGARDIGSIKRATRLGMGRCQGRYCALPALRLLRESGVKVSSASLAAPQLPARPVRISSVANEKREWRGHARNSLTTRPRPAIAQPLSRNAADLAIIGGGITGISAAYWAAKAGAQVVCLERGMINAEASGGNAGSLHLQLLSWDFGEGGISSAAPLRALPFQKEGIDLWISLRDELSQNFELALTGGLMVAENSEQVEFLESKVEAERRVGIATEIIGADEARRIAPEIARNIIAASWCAGEGKINPLIASNALLEAARSHGAVFEELAGASALAKCASGYRIGTSRGELAAKKVLIAAGGWSAEVAKLLGIDIPVRGAPIQIIVTEPAAATVPCLVAHAGRHITMKQTESGNILIGGAWTAGRDEAGRQIVRLESLEGNLWVAERIFPAVGQLTFIRSWGSMNIDIDGAPLISALPGHPDAVVAAAANGYTLAPLIGREAARLALNGKIWRDLEAFDLTRFN